MSHFYGMIEGTRGQATRCGHKQSGMHAIAAGWSGAIETHIWHDAESGEDRYRVSLRPWHGSGGGSRQLAGGVLNANKYTDEDYAEGKATR